MEERNGDAELIIIANIPRISVILPVYNGAEKVKTSIESILNQTFQDFELIIVNDCSTDNTLEIIKEYERLDTRIHVYSNRVNSKLPQTLNNGFSYAKGRFLTWTSDDNFYEPDALQVMYERLNSDSNIGMVYCDMNLVDPEGCLIRKNVMGDINEIIKTNVIGACFLYRKEISETVGFYDTNLFLAEDYDYWLSIYENYPIVHINRVLYNYRIHEKSLTATRKDEIKHATVDVWMKHKDAIFCKLHGMDRWKQFDIAYSYSRDSDKKFMLKSFINLDYMYVFHFMRQNPKTFFNYLLKK